jgi:outer membrane protein assembly factor BamB
MRPTPAILTLSCLILCSALHADDNWPAFRGPTGDGHSTAKGVPTRWSEKENIRWKTAIPGKAWSSPVLWGKQIWMTNAPADGTILSAICVDADTGKVLRDIKVFDNPRPAFCHDVNSHASSTPVIEEGRVYVHFGSAGTACIDTASGKILWTRRDLTCDHFRGAGSSPIIYKDLLILTFDGHDQQYVAALNKSDGKTIWKKDRNIKYPLDDGDWKKAYSTPRIVDVKGKPQMVSPSAEQTIAYDPATGEELWRVTHVKSMNASSRPVFGQGRFYLTSGYGNQLLAVRPDGRGDVTNTHVDYIYRKGVPSRSSLLLLDDTMYMVTDIGVASCMDVEKGKEVTTVRLGGNFFASPTYADGKIYFFDSDKGKGFVVEANREMKILAENKLDAGCMASPIIVGKSIFVRTRTDLYRIEEK